MSRNEGYCLSRQTQQAYFFRMTNPTMHKMWRLQNNLSSESSETWWLSFCTRFCGVFLFCLAFCEIIMFFRGFFLYLVGSKSLHCSVGMEKIKQLLGSFGKQAVKWNVDMIFLRLSCSSGDKSSSLLELLFFLMLYKGKRVNHLFLNALNIQVSFKGRSVSLAKIIFLLFSHVSRVCFLPNLLSVLPTSKRRM